MDILQKFTLDEIKIICAKSQSYRQFALQLGYSENSTDSVKKLIDEYQLDISHFKGQGWNKDSVDMSIFQYNKSCKSDTMIRALTILRGWKCEKCGRAEWEGQQIPLCVHHIDGNHINNQIENLQVLCPNCHAQTDNYCGRNKSKRPPIADEQFIEALRHTTSIRQALQKLGINYAAKYYYEKAHKLIEENSIVQKPKKEKQQKTKSRKKIKIESNHCVDCGKIINNRSQRCEECEHKRQRKTEWPQRDELKDLIRTQSFSAIGKRYNVSDNAIRKWCKNYELPHKKSEIKKYSDEEWGKI